MKSVKNRKKIQEIKKPKKQNAHVIFNKNITNSIKCS